MKSGQRPEGDRDDVLIARPRINERAAAAARAERTRQRFRSPSRMRQSSPMAESRITKSVAWKTNLETPRNRLKPGSQSCRRENQGKYDPMARSRRIATMARRR